MILRRASPYNGNRIKRLRTCVTRTSGVRPPREGGWKGARDAAAAVSSRQAWRLRASMGRARIDRAWSSLTLPAAVALGLWLASGAMLVAEGELVRQEATRLSMGCVYGIAAYSPGDDALPRFLDEALDEVDRIDRLMSHYRADSPLSELNRRAADDAVAVDRELFEFLVQAIGYSHESDGAFDVTVGPLMKAWGFFRGDGRVPAPAELAEARTRVGYGHVRLDPATRTVRFDTPGVELDLGGIAKGYAVDRAIALLRARGVTAALVSAGGSTVYALGAPPGQDAWTVSVQDPLTTGRVALTVALRDRALSIAGASEKFFERGSTRYAHIMDPRTGRPVRDVLAVAIVAPSGTAGDALDDAVFVKGVTGSSSYLKRYAGAEAYLFLPAGHGWRMVHLP
jgi:FAD:protein FMN transferase